MSEQISDKELRILLRELSEALDKTLTGDIVEFGCYAGDTSIALARTLQATNRRLYLYDSFEGLPEKSLHDTSPAGDQFKPGELRASKKTVQIKFRKANLPEPIIRKAWFSELLPEDIPSTVAFAFLDGDYYDSITTSLRLIWPRLVTGAAIVVDDYYNEALPGAAKAVDAWARQHDAISLRVESSLAIIHYT